MKDMCAWTPCGHPQGKILDKGRAPAAKGPFRACRGLQRASVAARTPVKCSHALCAWRMVETRPSATLGAAEGTSRVDPGVHRGDAATLCLRAAPPARHMVIRCACCRVRQQSLVDVPSVTTVAETPVSVHRARDTLPRAPEACESGEASGLCSLSTLDMSARVCVFDTSGRSTYRTVQTTLVTTHTGRSGAIWVLRTLSRPGHGFSHKVR